MKARMKGLFAGVLAAVAMSIALLPGMALADDAEALAAGDLATQASGGIPMYRLYNQWSGEHFYTASADECGNTVAAGWKYEGVGWTAPATGDPVYRLYNPYAGEHHYTMKLDERDKLIKAGWVDEGMGWCSDTGKAVPVYREYNPNMFSCNHNYTTDKAEHDYLASIGWRNEQIAWYGIAVDAETLAEYEAQRPWFEAQSLNGWWQSWGQSGMAWWHIVDGIVHYYQREVYDSSTYNYNGVGTLAEFEFAANETPWIASNYNSAGYQVIIDGNYAASWLYFNSDRNNLICAMLDGAGYSGTSSRTRVANPPQELVDLASAVE